MGPTLHVNSTTNIVWIPNLQRFLWFTKKLIQSKMNENILYVWFYRIIGAVLIITGLYLVLWGKNEERKFMLQKQPGMVQAETDHGAPRTTGHVKSSITQPLLPQSTENV